MAKARAEKRIEALAEALLQKVEDIEREPCPRCARPTLTIEHQRGSGIKVSCEGYDPASEDGECPYKHFAIYTSERELPRVTSETKTATPET